MSLTAILVLAAVFITALPAPAGPVHGSLKPGGSFNRQQLPDPSSRYLVSSPLRLMYGHRAGIIDFQAAWTLVPSAGDPALGHGDLWGDDLFRIRDPGRVLLSSSGEDPSFSIVHDIDRLSLGIRASFATLTAGRQAVYWGVARSVSPTDFLAPFRYGAMDTEYRAGVDAVRSVFPLGMLSELDAGYAPGRDGDLNLSAFWLRGRFYLLQTDATLLCARFRDNLMAGGSLNGTAGGGTAWLEAAAVRPGHFREDLNDDAYWSLSVGWDRSWLRSTLYGCIEYHFSSAGSEDASGYREAMTGPAVSRGNIYLLGRHYLCPRVIWDPAPLWTFSAGALISITDASAYLSLSGEYGAGQNTAVQCGLNLGLGEVPGDGGDLRSEFGSWPDILHAGIAYYF